MVSQWLSHGIALKRRWSFRISAISLLILRGRELAIQCGEPGSSHASTRLFRHSTATNTATAETATQIDRIIGNIWPRFLVFRAAFSIDLHGALKDFGRQQDAGHAQPVEKLRTNTGGLETSPRLFHPVRCLS